MNLEDLKKIARDNGVVGAGGAGFPAYAKMTDKADTVLLNCAECEPLLKLHRQLLASYSEEIVGMLDEVRAAMGAREAVVCVKSEYRSTIEAIKPVIKNYANVRLCELKSVYPAGDEVVLIYEATGRVISPGGLPIDENVVVYNVETMYNMYNASHNNKPVTNKLVSIVGEVEKPVTTWIPIGTSVKEAVALAGKITTKEPAFLMGGPMMGFIGNESTIVTKTTNAIIVLPKDHQVIARINKNIEVERRRASSSCCQCRTCTDMCPRHSLGHPIEPHRVMRAVANHDISDLSVFVNAGYCSGCGVCEKYACPQGLSPKSIIQEFKAGLRVAGIKPEKLSPVPVVSDREFRQVPVHRLGGKLGLAKYDVSAPFEDEIAPVRKVAVRLSQHIGAPAKAVVKAGDEVKCGQVIGEAADGLSVAIHCSINGVVDSVSDKEVVIRERN